MGTCYSSNTTKVRRANTNKQKSSSSCLGSLCNESESVQFQNKSQNENITNNIQHINSSFCIYQKDDKLNKDLNQLIEKYKDKLEIKKLNYIQIYNIFMNYAYDFTNNNFVICDTREETKEKTQLFLKKFRQINYTLKDIDRMNQERINRFCNFLKNKDAIFILKDETSLEIFENYITFFILNSNAQNFILKNLYVLNEYIQIYKENISNSYLENLYYFIDEDTIYEYYPKILINANDIKSSYLNNDNPNSNYSYAFINIYPHSANNEQNKNKLINKFDINYICNKNTETPDTFLHFFSKFNIFYILNFGLSDDTNISQKPSKYITHSESKRNKINDEEKKSLIKQKNITIPKDIQFEEFYRIIQKDFLSIIEELKIQMVQNNCVLIQFDDKIDNLFKYKLVYIIMFRITGLKFDDIFNYLKSNFFDIENESLIISKKEEINKLLV